jgi:hypothetical protein
MNADFEQFHAAELPGLAASANGALAVPYAAGLPPIAFRVGDRGSYTYEASGDQITATPGEDGAGTVVALSEAEWVSFVSERFTRYGLLYNGAASFPVGQFDDLSRWEPALRALWHGRPVYDPERNPIDLDLHTAFRPDDSDAEMAAFFQTAGYLHVRGLFSSDEVEALRDEVARLASLAKPDDTRTWWTYTPDGTPAVCQLKYGAVDSALVAGLHDDGRVRRLIDLSGEAGGLRPNLDRNEGTKIIFKNPGATDGLTDLPLHNDCGLGYHPVACPMVLVGLHLDDGTPESGQLHMVAGTHRSTTPDPAITDISSWPMVALETQAGDCSVHFGHTLHGAPPPVVPPDGAVPGRRTIYPAFANTQLFEAIRPFEDLVTAMQRSDGTTMQVDERLGAG